jgi:hypothetical protein
MSRPCSGAASTPQAPHLHCLIVVTVLAGALTPPAGGVIKRPKSRVFKAIKRHPLLQGTIRGTIVVRDSTTASTTKALADITLAASACAGDARPGRHWSTSAWPKGLFVDSPPETPWSPGAADTAQEAAPGRHIPARRERYSIL